MIEILNEIQNVMDNIVVFGLGIVGIFSIVSGFGEITPKKSSKKKISVSANDKNKAA